MAVSGKTIVFVDGENFQKKVKQVFKAGRLVWDDKRFTRLKLAEMLAALLPEVKIDAVKYYGAGLHVYPETKDKSEELIAQQRALKSNLENQKVEFIISGNVRLFKLPDGPLLFREKGVDVRIAVDAISLAADKKLKTAVIVSSDSDMQPVIKELRRRKIHVIYVGFQVQPNRGLIYSCDETVLIRKSELQTFVPKDPPRKLQIRHFDEP